MKPYIKPTAEKLEFDFADQVVAESGSNAGRGCYTVDAYIHQTPQTGRGEYRIQANGKHNADHTCNHQIFTISFNMPVTYVSSNGTLKSGDGTPTLVIDYYYHNNPIDNIGLGDIVLQAGSGLAITGMVLTD